MKRIKTLLIYVIIILSLIGCKKEKEPMEMNIKERAPESAAGLLQNIDDILNSLGNIERISMNLPVDEGELNDNMDNTKETENQEDGGNQDIEKKDQSEGGEEDQSGEGQSSENGQSSEDQGKDNNKSSSKNEDEKQKVSLESSEIGKQLKTQWDAIENKQEAVHRLWNEFEAELINKSADKEDMDRFESNLNNMTKSVEDRNIIQIYDYASQVLNSLKIFFDLYPDNLEGEYAYIRYVAFQSYIKAINGDLEGAKDILSKGEHDFGRIRAKVTKEDEKAKIEKIALSLSDFKNSLPIKSKRLYMIKKDTIINNITEMSK